MTSKGSTTSPFATNGSEYMRIHNFQHLECPKIYIYKYDIAAYAVASGFMVFSIVLIAISISICRKKNMKIEAEEKYFSITYPYTNVAYYMKNYQSLGIE